MQGRIYPYTYPPQSLVAVSGGSTYPWKQDSIAFFHDRDDPQINEDDYAIGHSLADHSFIWTQYHEGFQPQRPPYVFPGQESVPPASLKGPTYVNVADIGTSHTSHNSWPDHVSMSTFSDPSDQYAPVDKEPNFLVSSSLTETLSLSTQAVGVYEGASALSDEEPDKPFKCSGCSKRFAQKQSVGRHYRKRHDPKHCLFSSCNFKWGGPYDYRHHLKGQHKLENEVIDTILGKSAESRCRATIIRRDLPN